MFERFYIFTVVLIIFVYIFFLDKLKISYDFPFDVVERENNFYISSEVDYANFTMNVLGDVKFSVKEGCGDQVSSEYFFVYITKYVVLKKIHYDFYTQLHVLVALLIC